MSSNLALYTERIVRSDLSFINSPLRIVDWNRSAGFPLSSHLGAVCYRQPNLAEGFHIILRYSSGTEPELASFPLSSHLGAVYCRQPNPAEGFHIILRYSSGTEPAWSSDEQIYEVTKTDAFQVRKLNEETIEFIEQHHLGNDTTWLQLKVPDFFPGADFEVEVLPAENEEEKMLALRVYGSLSVSEFRERRRALCKAMIEAGHRTLYEVISIFQRRTCNDGRQAISWYSALSAA